MEKIAGSHRRQENSKLSLAEMALKQRTKISLRTLGKLKRRRRKQKGLFDEEEYVPKFNPSMVYIEDPSDLSHRSQPMSMDIVDFWHFLHESFWKGRLRICDGDLLHKLLDCFDDLVQNKAIGKVITTRKFRMKNDTQMSYSLNEEESQMEKRENGKFHVVRAAFSYYGGIPLKKHRKVTFAPLPNSTYIPPIRHVLPIIKHAEPCGQNQAKEQARSSALFLPSPLHWESTDVHSEDNDWFVSPVPEDLAKRCIKAAELFLVVKEQFTDSETWRTVTSLTFSRKERKWTSSRIVQAMPSYYTSVDFPMYGYALERRPIIDKSKGLMTMKTLEVVKKYVVSTSRNPKLKRTVTRKEKVQKKESKR